MTVIFLRRPQRRFGPGNWRRWYAFGVLACTLVLVPRAARAQRTVMLNTVGITVPGAVVSEPPHSKLRESGRPASVSVVSRDQQHRRWPWVMLGGGILGGAATTVFALASCDQGCHDDGALAYIPYVAGIGAGVGALVGALIGLAVDAR